MNMKCAWSMTKYEDNNKANIRRARESDGEIEIEKEKIEIYVQTKYSTQEEVKKNDYC